MVKEYQWKAGKKGEPVATGVILAESQDAAARTLLQEYDYLIQLKERRRLLFRRGRQLSSMEREAFFRQMGILLKSQVPLLKVLNIMAMRGSPATAALCRTLGENLSKGHSLSQALGRHEEALGELAPKLASAGEKSGQTALVFLYLAGYYQRKRKLRNLVLGASLYPLLVLFLGGLLFLYFMAAILPVFAGLYQTLQVPLPLGIRGMLAVRSCFMENTAAAAGFLAVLMLYGRTLFKRRSVWENRIPFLRNWIRLFWENRYISLLALLLKSGLPLHDSLAEAAAILPEGPFRHSGLRLLHLVDSGQPLFRAARQTPQLCSSLTVEFMAIGEESGKMGEMMTEAAVLLGQEIRHRMAAFKQLLEPMLLLTLAALSVMILYCLLSPMTGLLNGIPARF